MKSAELNELVKISEKAIEQLNGQINIFGLKLDQTLKDVPENEKQKVAELKAVTTKAINLAKMGKAEEAKAIITDFQNKQNAG